MKIGTHSGTFHCDDAMAVAMLKTLDRFKSAEVVRSRDPKIWATCDIVVDVGGCYKYDPTNEKTVFLDHHQRGFTLVLSDIRTDLKNQDWAGRTKLSSAGLVFAHFGQEILKKLTQNELDAVNVDFQNRIYKHCYTHLIEEVDAIDNGVDQYSIEMPNGQSAQLKRNYSVTTNLSGRVAHLNPNWQVENPDYDANFPQANKICLEEFLSRVDGFHSWWKAREIVVEAVDARLISKTENSANSTTSSQDLDDFLGPELRAKVLDLTLSFCPWKAHLLELEEENYLPPNQILYCLYKSGETDFRVQTLPKEKGSFASRKSLPEAWRGKRDAEFEQAAGVADLIFCHMAGFLCGSKSRESQLALVKLALEAE